MKKLLLIYINIILVITSVGVSAQDKINKGQNEKKDSTSSESLKEDSEGFLKNKLNNYSYE